MRIYLVVILSFLTSCLYGQGWKKYIIDTSLDVASQLQPIQAKRDSMARLDTSFATLLETTGNSLALVAVKTGDTGWVERETWCMCVSRNDTLFLMIGVSMWEALNYVIYQDKYKASLSIEGTRADTAKYSDSLIFTSKPSMEDNESISGSGSVPIRSEKEDLTMYFKFSFTCRINSWKNSMPPDERTPEKK